MWRHRGGACSSRAPIRFGLAVSVRRSDGSHSFFHYFQQQERPCKPATVALRLQVTIPHRASHARASQSGMDHPMKARGRCAAARKCARHRSQLSGPSPDVWSRCDLQLDTGTLYLLLGTRYLRRATSFFRVPRGAWSPNICCWQAHACGAIARAVRENFIAKMKRESSGGGRLNLPRDSGEVYRAINGYPSHHGPAFDG